MLKGGTSPAEGNVWAVNSRCQFGPVCDDDWGGPEARVVCRQLGFKGSRATISKWVFDMYTMIQSWALAVFFYFFNHEKFYF